MRVRVHGVVPRIRAHGRRIRVLRQQRVDDWGLLFDLLLLLWVVRVLSLSWLGLDMRLLIGLVIGEHGLFLGLRCGGSFLGLGLLCAGAARVRGDAFHVLSEAGEAHACCVAVCDFELLGDEVPVDLGCRGQHRCRVGDRGGRNVTDFRSSCFSIVYRNFVVCASAGKVLLRFKLAMLKDGFGNGRVCMENR